MRGVFRRVLVAVAGFALVGAVAVPAQGASDRGVEASGGRAEHDRVVAFWTPERVARAVPRDPVFDDRGLAYLRGANGSLTPLGHSTPARVRATAPASAAAAPAAPEQAGAPVPAAADDTSVTDVDPDGDAIGTAYDFRATVTDPDGVKSVSFVIHGPDGFTQANGATNLDGNVWGVDFSGFWAGDWNWEIRVKDGARRGGNTTSHGPYEFTVGTGSGGGGSTGEVVGESWETEGGVKETTGKVLFALGSNYYVCSASVIPDPVADGSHSYVMTAAHCVYDGARGGRFATNWMFVPDYDSLPAPITTNGSFCTDTTYGCWTADALVVDSGFASQRRFTSTATLHDYAVVRVGAGGDGGGVQLDDAVGTQSVSFAEGTLDADSDPDTHLFGYPAASPYDGTDLVYSFGDLGRDPLNDNRTYRVASDMTGGSSGGPWFQQFSVSAGTGAQMSVNSYGYQGVDAMHGPVFNGNTRAVYDAAQNATGNTIVAVG